MDKRNPIWKFEGMSERTGDRHTGIVYHVGGMNFEITVSRRPKHRYTAKYAVDHDGGEVRREVERVYALSNVKFEKFT